MGGSRLEECDSSKEGQDEEVGRAEGYLGNSFASSGISEVGLEEGELPQDSSREVAGKGHFNLEGRLREMSWEDREEEEGSTEEDNCSSISMSTVF